MILLVRDLSFPEAETEETNVFEELYSAETEPTETIQAYDDTELMYKLDTVIEGQRGIYQLLWLILCLSVVVVVFKVLWTVFAKWFFGGI